MAVKDERMTGITKATYAKMFSVVGENSVTNFEDASEMFFYSSNGEGKSSALKFECWRWVSRKGDNSSAVKGVGIFVGNLNKYYDTVKTFIEKHETCKGKGKYAKCQIYAYVQTLDELNELIKALDNANKADKAKATKKSATKASTTKKSATKKSTKKEAQTA